MKTTFVSRYNDRLANTTTSTWNHVEQKELQNYKYALINCNSELNLL